MQDGTPIPSFMSISGTTLSVDPTLTSEAGTYLLKVTPKTWEGNDSLGAEYPGGSSGTALENLSVTVTCAVSTLTYVSTAWASHATYYQGETAVTYALPTYTTSPTGCASNVVYTITKSDGSPVPSYLSIVGNQIQYSGGVDGDIL